MHIVLCCNQGMSTSMLVKKMREAAVKNGVDVQIDAYPISEIEEKAPDAAVILLGPQVRFELNRVKGLFPNIPVESINPQDYGLVRGEKRAQPRDRARRQVISLSRRRPIRRRWAFPPSIPPYSPPPQPHEMTVRREPVTGAANTDERTVQWRTHLKPLTWKCCACR